MRPSWSLLREPHARSCYDHADRNRAVSCCVGCVQALFLSIVIFLLFVLYLLKTGHAMERRWNDRETAARFPKALFNEYEALNLKIRAQHGPLSRRGCRRKVLHCCRKAVCYKSAAVRRLEHVEENLVYAAIRARFLVPEATAAGTKPGANRMTGRRGSTVADVMQSATGQPARVTLSEEADTVYKERGTCDMYPRGCHSTGARRG